MKALLIPENQEREPNLVDIPDWGIDQLKEIQRLIGGYAEPIITTRLAMKKNCALVDDTARVKDKLPNFRATREIGYPVYLFGDVVVVGYTAGNWTEYNQ